MPAYNESATIVGVLDDLDGRVDHVVVVNDGSTDRTGPLVDAWAAGRAGVTVIHFPENRGLSAALRAGWEHVRQMLQRGEIGPGDVAFSIDADGQHEPEAIEGMVRTLVDGGYDCVIGRRDLSYHSPYKRFGNLVMTWIGRLSGGHRFEDIESGYRVFRVAPLLAAQEYYRGYRYSETVEVAVLLARMGYRVDNTHAVRIPVARTRTRLSDAAVDALTMPLAWYRLACWRGVPVQRRSAAIALIAAGVIAAWGLTLGAMLLHGFYLGDDSANSYAHVWYIADQIYAHGRLPLHMALLENGDAMTFPYAIVPWLPAALVRPVLGDWAVTLSMAAGVALMVASATRLRPGLRNPVLLGVFLVNPFLWNGVTQFQLATIWSLAFLFLGAAEHERGHRVRAVSLLALAIAAHPQVGSFGLVIYAGWDAVEHRKLDRHLLAESVGAAILASPAVVMFALTPAIWEGSRAHAVVSVLDNCRRLTIPLLVLGLPRLKDRVFAHQRLVMGAGVASSALLLAAIPPSGLWERPAPRFGAYLDQVPVEVGSSYRALVKNNHEDGMVELLQADAVLSHEFFSESVRRQSFPSTDVYACYLATRHVGHVVVSHEYARTNDLPLIARLPFLTALGDRLAPATNEPEILARLASMGLAREEYRDPSGNVAYATSIPESFARGSVHDCGL